jgi:hypothetical protein
MVVNCGEHHCSLVPNQLTNLLHLCTQQRQFTHFYVWALGDGHLQQLHPEFCYYCPPNHVETIIMAAATTVRQRIVV